MKEPIYSGGEPYYDKQRGKYRAVIWSADGTGKRRYKTKTLEAEGIRAARKEAAAWKAEREAEAASAAGGGAGADAARRGSVAAWVDSLIDALEASRSIEASTVRGYRTSAKHIGEKLGAVTLADLRPEDIQAWEAHLTQTRGLSSSSVGKAHRLLKMALSDAVVKRAIEWNPANAVKPPKRAKAAPGINSLDKDGAERLIKALRAAAPSFVKTAALISLFTGLRNGEVCGLTWRDIDARNGVIWVERSIGVGKGGTYVKETKTDRRRDVALPKSLAADLAEWKESQRERFAASMATLREESYVIGDADGYRHPDTLTNAWRVFAEVNGVTGTKGRRVTFHDLRHTWATLYLANGGDVKTAASNLGHADAAMTLNVYASADPDAKRRAALLTDAILTGGA